MRIIQSPEAVVIDPNERSVFLAGSIDMGSTVDWQQDLAKWLEPSRGTLFNPRRAHWDPSWQADMSSPVFKAQVEWELAAMAAADLIAFYFSPGSQAPVTLLELGLAACTGKALVCCPTGYWRKGNVDAVCRHYGIPTVDTLESLAHAIRGQCNGHREHHESHTVR